MTDPFDAADAAGHHLEQQVTSLQGQLTAAQQAAAAAAAKDAADVAALAAETAKEQTDQAQIAELEHELDPAPVTVFGANIGTDTGTLTKVDTELGGIGAVRFYQSPGKGIHFPTSAELGGDLGNKILVLSAKLLPQDVLAGKYDAQITATAKACPTDQYTLLDLWHEPWDDVYKHNTFTAQQYRDAQARFAQLIHAVGNPKVQVALILMGETWNGGTAAAPRNWRDFYAGPQYADVFCTDEYAWSPTAPKDLTTLFVKGRAAADSEGKPFCVTETNVSATTFTGQARYDALTVVGQRMTAASNGPVKLIFGVKAGAEFDLVSDPKALAALQAGLNVVS